MTGKSSQAYLTPSWPVPANVKAYVSTRKGGVSQGEFSSLNLGAHVGDDMSDVQTNRQIFSSIVAMPDSLIWLNQVHGIDVAVLPNDCDSIAADAATTTELGQVCAVLTADCLPVFFCNKSGTQVAVAHAGWRSLCSGVLEETLSHFSVSDDIVVWLGPAIGPEAFEVGGEVRDAFIERQKEAEAAFTLQNNGKWLGDLYLLARQRLAAQGVTEVYGGDFCTYQNEDQFFSYRREGKTGRMASVIWLEASFSV
ncbi:peptidoglycan editing factor PgeF [Marinomonas flavescens]|uniref:peptidoglycan editing factor PgeF n=1 Tax=Marinomonas flavescens TaxID=2529379 RepID=UPI0010562CE3|nr:peptidoglycan editing factor PgeF [Marinomonas flavescens]